MTMKLYEKPWLIARRIDQHGARTLMVHRARVYKYTTGRPPVVRQAGVEKIITGSAKFNQAAQHQ